MWWEKLHEVLMMTETFCFYQDVKKCISTEIVIENEVYFRFESLFFFCAFGKKNFQFKLDIWITKFLNHDFKSMKVYFSLVFMFMCYAPWVHTNVIYYSYVDLYIYHVFSNFGNSRTAKITNNSNCRPDIFRYQYISL